MNILYLAHSCPYPPNKGDRIRSFHILTHLATRHEVRLVYPSFSEEDVARREELQKYCREVRTVRLSAVGARIRAGVSLLCGRSLTEGYFHSSKLQRLIDPDAVDAVLVDCSSMASYVRNSGKPKVIDFVDVDSDKWRLFAQWSTFPKSAVYRMEAKRLRDLELRLVEEFDAVLVISRHEKDLLPAGRRTVIVSNGVDCNQGQAPPRRRRATLIFMGAMGYFANVDAVLYFSREILPLIKNVVPDVRFQIVGMDPARDVRRLEDDTTEVTGYVPDVGRYLAEATVCVAPLRIARGVQNKILEAMAGGVPVVATSDANSGIDAIPGQEILIGDSPESFASAVLRLLADEELRNRLSTQAAQLLKQRFQWERNLSVLDEVLGSITRSPGGGPRGRPHHNLGFSSLRSEQLS